MFKQTTHPLSHPLTDKSDMKTYTQSPWSLSDLFPSHDSPEMEAAFSELESQVASFETLRSQLTNNIPEAPFLDLLHRQESIYALAFRIGSFASLSFSANTQNQSRPFWAAWIRPWHALTTVCYSSSCGGRN
jgi:oligoendopeptidase F